MSLREAAPKINKGGLSVADFSLGKKLIYNLLCRSHENDNTAVGIKLHKMT